jgi:protein ImuB
VETVSWAGASKSLLPEDNVEGESLQQFIERLSVRLGDDHVLRTKMQADHRPERMQSWQPARSNPGVRATSHQQALPADAIYPAWLLPDPQRLEVRGEKPHYQGPLRLLVGPQRLETGWWDAGEEGPVVRDYFIARSDHAGLIWIYRERFRTSLDGDDSAEPVRWYLHGIYA